MPRTRSATAHRKVLDAAVHLIAEHGVDATSMDAIAQKSGVSKATIYKHWADKEALLLEVLSDLNGLDSRPEFDSGDIRADMVGVLSYQPPDRTGMREKIMPHLVAYSARNAAFGHTWRNRVMEPPRTELKRLLRHGMERGEFRAGLNIEFSLALLLGPLLYWHVFLRRHHEAHELAHGVVDAFWRAFGGTKTGPAFKQPRVQPTVLAAALRPGKNPGPA